MGLQTFTTTRPAASGRFPGRTPSFRAKLPPPRQLRCHPSSGRRGKFHPACGQASSTGSHHFISFAATPPRAGGESSTPLRRRPRAQVPTNISFAATPPSGRKGEFHALLRRHPFSRGRREAFSPLLSKEGWREATGWFAGSGLLRCHPSSGAFGKRLLQPIGKAHHLPCTCSTMSR